MPLCQSGPHFERPVVRRELRIPTFSDGGSNSMVKAKPNQLAHSELDVVAPLIMLLLHVNLRLKEPVPDFYQELVVVFHLLVHRCATSHVGIIRE